MPDPQRDLPSIPVTARGAAGLYLMVHFPGASERELVALTELLIMVAGGTITEAPSDHHGDEIDWEKYKLDRERERRGDDHST